MIHDFFYLIKMYKKVFEFILYLIQHTTSSEPTILDHEKKWKHDKETLDVIDTGYGFNIDQWDISVKCLDYILSWIPIYDEEPTIDPMINKVNLEKLYSKYIPPEAVDATSLIDFLMNNTGSYFVKDNIVDFSVLESYSVRPGYHRYGGKVYLKNGEIDYFEYLGNRYEANNQLIDKIIRSTLCMVLMIKLHALKTHLCTSQKSLYKFYGKYDKDHTLAPFLQLCTFENLKVNRKIPILVSDHGLVARLFAFTNESFNRLLYETLQEESFNREEILGNPNTEWHKQLSKYSEIVDNYIDTFDISVDDKLELSNFFISSTAIHNMVGDSTLAATVISTFFLPAVYIDNPGFVSNLQVNLLVTLLLTVSGRQPLCIDTCCENVFENETQRKNWIQFRENLLNEFPDNNFWFNIRTFECSIGF